MLSLIYIYCFTILNNEIVMCLKFFKATNSLHIIVFAYTSHTRPEIFFDRRRAISKFANWGSVACKRILGEQSRKFFKNAVWILFIYLRGRQRKREREKTSSCPWPVKMPGWHLYSLIGGLPVKQLNLPLHYDTTFSFIFSCTYNYINNSRCMYSNSRMFNL